MVIDGGAYAGDTVVSSVLVGMHICLGHRVLRGLGFREGIPATMTDHDHGLHTCHPTARRHVVGAIVGALALLGLWTVLAPRSRE